MKKVIALILLQFFFINAHSMMSEDGKGGLPNTKSDTSNRTDKIYEYYGYEYYEHETSTSLERVYVRKIYPPQKPELSELTQENVTARIIQTCQAITRNYKDIEQNQNASFRISLAVKNKSGSTIKIIGHISIEEGILFSKTEFNPTSDSNNPVPDALRALAYQFLQQLKKAKLTF